MFLLGLPLSYLHGLHYNSFKFQDYEYVFQGKRKGIQEEISKDWKQKTLKYYYKMISISLCYYLELRNVITT